MIYDTERVEALSVLGLVTACPLCGGTGQPEGYVDIRGETFAVECDCTGMGFFFNDQAAERFGQAVRLREHFSTGDSPLRSTDTDRIALHAFLSPFLQLEAEE